MIFVSQMGGQTKRVQTNRVLYGIGAKNVCMLVTVTHRFFVLARNVLYNKCHVGIIANLAFYPICLPTDILKTVK